MDTHTATRAVTHAQRLADLDRTADLLEIAGELAAMCAPLLAEAHAEAGRMTFEMIAAGAPVLVDTDAYTRASAAIDRLRAAVATLTADDGCQCARLRP